MKHLRIFGGIPGAIGTDRGGLRTRNTLCECSGGSIPKRWRERDWVRAKLGRSDLAAQSH